MAPTLLNDKNFALSKTISSYEINDEAKIEKIQLKENKPISNETKEKEEYEWKIVWKNVIIFTYLHLGAIYGIYLSFTVAKWQTTACAFFIAFCTSLGITAGAHRLWSHRSYKAKMPLQLILCLFQTMAFQNHIYEWVRDHRVHHKYSETDADPHNAERGFFFSHVGWLLVRKHKDVIEKGRQIDMSDLEQNPIVMFQKRHYMKLMPFCCFIIPALIPYYCWNEKFWVSWYVTSIMRYTISVNFTWLVNSAAHIWGSKPYDKNIGPTENRAVVLLAIGEGWHNYHHVFPWDYKAAELGGSRNSLTTRFINFFARIGWAYDLKVVPDDIIRNRVLRTGDGTHEVYNKCKNSHKGQVWGWGDKDMTDEDKQFMKLCD